MRIYQIIFLALACLVPLVQLSKLNFIKYENVTRHMLHYGQQVLQCAIHEGYCTFLEGSKNWTDFSATITDGCVETFNASSPNHLPTPPTPPQKKPTATTTMHTCAHTHTHACTHARTHTHQVCSWSSPSLASDLQFLLRAMLVNSM